MPLRFFRKGNLKQTLDGPQSEADKLLAAGFVEVSNLDPTLDELKTEAKSRIDFKAEQMRAKYLTAAPLQSATYVEKAREAREFKAAGYPSAPFAPATWPYVDAEMRAAGDATPQAACDRILAEAAQYAQVKGAAIEYQRRAGKITVGAGATEAAINAAEAAVLTALDAL